MKIKDIVKIIENFAPKNIAESWDNVGLLIGDEHAVVSKILFTLDVTEQVIDEAIEKGVQLIIAHHPNLFKGVNTLVHQDPFQKNYRRLIQNDINVYVCHTNIDNAKGGMNDWLSESLGLININVLQEQGTYTIDGQQIVYGTGRIGEYEQSISLAKLIEIVQKQLTVSHLKIAKAKNITNVKRVALCGGSGSDFYEMAILKGADVYLTGDVSYHKAQDMQTKGLTLIDIGHYAEVIFVEKMYEIYDNWIKENNLDLQLIKSNVNTNPFE